MSPLRCVCRREDELSFKRGVLITHVVQQEGGWWRGDHGGRRQHWFPANFTQLEEAPGGSLGSGREYRYSAVVPMGIVFFKHSQRFCLLRNKVSKKKQGFKRIKSPIVRNAFTITQGFLLKNK